MTHFEFVNEINNCGVHIGSTKVENRKAIEIIRTFGKSDFVIIENFNVEYSDKNSNVYNSPLKAIICKAIDMDSWKHSWHIDIRPDNYKKFRDIIQQKIIDRAKEIDELLTVYFQINYELSQLPPNEQEDERSVATMMP